MLNIIDSKSLNGLFDDNMTLEKAKQYLEEYKDSIFHPKYYQSLLFMKNIELKK